MAKINIGITPLAREKLKEIVNGSKAEIIEFIENIDRNIDNETYNLFLKAGQMNYYYKKCKNIYLIFTINEKNGIGVVDFLTEIEFNNVKKTNPL